jgi:putative endonuclease
MKKSAREVGDAGERDAVSFLKRQGFAILGRNFTYQHGEIDIIAKDGEELVFVEVKIRRSARFGLPEESVTVAKQELIRRTAEGYAMTMHLDNVPCRFDVVAITMEEGIKKFVHYKNAF